MSEDSSINILNKKSEKDWYKAKFGLVDEHSDDLTLDSQLKCMHEKMVAANMGLRLMRQNTGKFNVYESNNSQVKPCDTSQVVDNNIVRDMEKRQNLTSVIPFFMRLPFF